MERAKYPSCGRGALPSGQIPILRQPTASPTHPPTQPHDSLFPTFPHHDSRLTKRQQDVFQLSKHHGAVLHLVVQLQALNEVLKVAGFLGLLDVAVDWVELVGDKNG